MMNFTFFIDLIIIGLWGYLSIRKCEISQKDSVSFVDAVHEIHKEFFLNQQWRHLSYIFTLVVDKKS